MAMTITAKDGSIFVDDKTHDNDHAEATNQQAEAVIDNGLMDRLESLTDRFEYAVEQHAELLKLFGKLTPINTDSTDASPPNRKYRIPKKGVWRDFLQHLAESMGSSTFTSNDFPRHQRHMLSLLSNKYRVLTVMDRMGRTKIYQVDPEVLEIVKRTSRRMRKSPKRERS